ncbi:MAG TPA: TetR/AcrR family transcriptional regulator [Candidatus Binataceae bacterium]|nr:TetR/AcrR family transcriptional regulator [Candidatus Binataceae bacterium]
MAPRPDVSEERKDQILEAAAAVFAKRGLHDSTMDDIVERSALSKGGVYWYFKSKDELVAALVDRMCASALEKLKELVKLGGSAIDRFIAMDREMADEMRQIARLRAVMLEFYALAARDREVRSKLRSYFHDTIETIEALVRQGIERGEFRPVDPHQTAIAVEAMYEGLMLVWVVNPATIDLEESSRRATELLVAGLRALPAGCAGKK